MANVLELTMTQSYNVDALNRNAVCEQDVENGSVFELLTYSEDADKHFVWQATAPTANTVKNVWMACSPEVVITKGADGNEYRGLNPDPRAFVNIAGRTIDVFKPMVGDIIRMTAEGIADADTNDYLVINPSNFKLMSAAAATEGFSLKKIGTGRLMIGQGGIANAPVPMYKYEVVNN